MNQLQKLSKLAGVKFESNRPQHNPLGSILMISRGYRDNIDVLVHHKVRRTEQYPRTVARVESNQGSTSLVTGLIGKYLGTHIAYQTFLCIF